MKKALLSAALFSAINFLAFSPIGNLQTKISSKKDEKLMNVDRQSEEAQENSAQLIPEQVMVEIFPGDTLTTIAEAHGTTYVRIFDANTFIKDPDIIYPGDKVRIPTNEEVFAARELPVTAVTRISTQSYVGEIASKRQREYPSAAPQVASGSVWDRLAACESGGNWYINTGNGYYGGLQFTVSTWRGVGGSGYPHENSREEQIVRAELLLARSGWSQWPACARKLGLL